MPGRPHTWSPGRPLRPSAPPRRHRADPAARVPVSGAPRSGRRPTVWARSLQVRVVTITLLVSVLLVGAASWFILQQVAAGLVSNRVEEAVRASGVGLTRLRVDAAQADPGDPGQYLTDVAGTLTQQSGGGTGTGLFDVVVFDVTSKAGTGGDPTAVTGAGSGPRTSRSVSAASVPSVLRAQLSAGDADSVYYSIGTISYTDGTPTAPGVVVGGRVNTAGDLGYEVFYLYSMADQVDVLGLLERSVALAGTFLVVLLAVVAGTVTRIVVRPLRAAAGIAGSYASGDLSERMVVRGADDIARLAGTFNQMATALEEQFLRLEELSRVQRRFVSDVSHELRTPLTTVRMAADVIYDDRDGLPPRMNRSAELLHDQLDRFEALLVDLLEISRFDAGAAALAAVPTDLRVLIADAVQAARPLAGARGCALVVHEPTSPVTAEVDPRRITRILRNLLANAVDHSEGLPVEVSVDGDGRVAAIVVRDHGVGLLPAETERVFDRFWRADPARARTTGGTGLGLSISAEDAALHGGRLQAWGIPGDGASFRLLVPVRVGGPLVTRPLPLVPADAPGRLERWAPRPAVPAAPAVPASPADRVSAPDAGPGGSR